MCNRCVALPPASHNGASTPMSPAMSNIPSHDQNFKNLILDYPRQALEFFAPEEAAGIDDSVTITPIRQEQLKNRLGDRFHELDVPLKVEWPDGRRAALLFLLEEESDPARFSIHRLGRYCLELAELMDTDRVVPIVIFLRGSDSIRMQLVLGSERRAFLSFDYIACVLPEMPAEQYKDSPNIVARITLPTMGYVRQQVIDVMAWALRGLKALEPDVEKQIKYAGFIDVYSHPDDNERRLFAQRYPNEEQAMTSIIQRAITQGLEEGLQKGRQEGRQEGEAAVLLRQLVRRFGPLGAATIEQVQQASSAQLEQWADNFVDARSLSEVFGGP